MARQAQEYGEVSVRQGKLALAEAIIAVFPFTPDRAKTYFA